jgi:phosphatidate cytidylyltransferase
LAAKSIRWNRIAAPGERGFRGEFEPLKRLLTAVVLLPFALAAVFKLSDGWFWLFVVGLVSVAAWEFAQISAAWAPGASRWMVVLAVPAASALLAGALYEGARPALMWSLLLGLLVLLSVGAAMMVLLAGTPIKESLAALGVMGWGTAYFSVAAVSLWSLQVMDPWLLILLLAAVWMGDSAAYYIGSAFGRHKLAPVVSPNKSWEGSAASVAASVAVALIWSWSIFGAMRWPIILVVIVAAGVGQLGDLAESMIKRGAGVKDSGTLLPGHGGMWDRLDALLFAAPIMLLGLWLIGFDGSAMP